jgi:hypothetical protein
VLGDALERAGNEAQATITVREKEGTLAFEIGAQGDQPSPGLNASATASRHSAAG